MAEVHDLDAGDLGCGTGLPRAFAERLRSIAVGDVLRATVKDAAAREDLPALARMLGHSVQSVEDAPDGRLVITVERGKMSEKILFNCTHGKEDAERATLPFVAANVAATAGQEALVVCTIEAVWLGTEGGTAGVQAPGLPALSELYDEFVGNGGQVWLCGACTKPRGITEEQLAKGASIVGAAKIVEALVGGAKAVSLA